MIFWTGLGNLPESLAFSTISRNSIRSYFFSISSIVHWHADFDPPPFWQPLTNCFLTFGGYSLSGSSVSVSSVVSSVVVSVVVGGRRSGRSRCPS